MEGILTSSPHSELSCVSSLNASDSSSSSSVGALFMSSSMAFLNSFSHSNDDIMFLQSTLGEFMWLLAPLVVVVCVFALWGLACASRKAVNPVLPWIFSHCLKSLKFSLCVSSPSASSSISSSSTLILASQSNILDASVTRLAPPTSNILEGEVTLDFPHGVHHLAVIMDGNRRYGRIKYGNATLGHRDGGQALVNCIDWCTEARISMLTVYAFSTENWNRDPAEVGALMSLIEEFATKIEQEAVAKHLRVVFLVSDAAPIPQHLTRLISQIEHSTREGHVLTLNVALSYGSRSEIVRACKSVVADVVAGKLSEAEITEQVFQSRLLTKMDRAPDLLLRTSGECRISNFLLFQLAYSELIFVNKHWPELTKFDFYQILSSYAHRNRRYGK